MVALQASAEASGVGFSIAYFVPCLVIGFFVVMNMFVSILLESFAEEEEEEEEEEEDGEGGEGDGDPPPQNLLKQAGLATDDGSSELPPLEGLSLGCLPPTSCIRYVCQCVVTHPVFDSFIILLIIVSSICLALDVPRLDPNSELKAQLDYLNYWMTGLFVGEMALKIVAYGFACTGETAYLKDSWNVLDFNIVLISLLGLLADIVPLFGRLKALRILRVLRPLRLLQRNPGMKIIISSLIKTIPSCIDVSAVVMVFHIVFAILGMMLFMGRFGACTDESITTRAECVPTASRQRFLTAQAELPPRPPSHLSSLTGRYQPPLLLSASSSTLPIPITPSPSAAPLVDALPHVALTRGVASADARTALGAPASEAPSSDTTTAEADLQSLLKRRAITRGRALNARRKQMSSRSARRVHAITQQQEALSRRGRALKGGGDDGDDEGDDLPIEWLNPAFGSFDNFGEAMLILYVASTGDGWEEFMWAGMDATEVDVAPVRNDFSPMSAYFLGWMVVGAFIALNLFVGAIVDNVQCHEGRILALHVVLCTPTSPAHIPCTQRGSVCMCSLACPPKRSRPRLCRMLWHTSGCGLCGLTFSVHTPTVYSHQSRDRRLSDHDS